MARQRDKSPSLMDADFPMRRHGIQIGSENEQSNAHADVVDDDDDDVVFICEEKTTKTKNQNRSRNNSSSSSNGSENNNVNSAVNMDKNVSGSKNTTKNNNSWSRESSVDVETVSPPPRAPVATYQANQVGDEDVIFIREKIPIPRAEEAPRCDGKTPQNTSSLPGVDFESDPQQNSNPRRKRGPPSQPFFLDKRRRGNEADSCEVPAWMQGEGVSYERRPRSTSRWDNNPSVDSQNTPVQLQGWELHQNSIETQSNLPSTPVLPQSTDNRSNSTNAAWTPITLTGPQSSVVNVQNKCNDVPQTNLRIESQVAITSSQANQEGDIRNGRGDAFIGRVNVDEGRSKERERHSSGNSRRDRSRSRSHSLERKRRDSRNRSRSRERHRSGSPSREQRERRPSGSSYAIHHTYKERRVSGNSNHSYSSLSSERGWKNHKERRNFSNTNYRGRGAGNGRCTPHSGYAKNYHHHKHRNENYDKYGNAEWYRGGHRNGYNMYGDDRDNTNVFARGQSQEFHNPNLIPISPNFIPSIRNNWGNGQNVTTPIPNVLTNSRQIPETETSTSSQRKNDNISQPRQDPPSNNVQPQRDDKDEDCYPPISHTKQRIAHMGSANRNGANATPAPVFNAEEVRQTPGVPTNSTQTQRSTLANSATKDEPTRNPYSPCSDKKVIEILKLIKTCSKCYGRIFDDRKTATAHLSKDHLQKLCHICFKPVSIKGVAYKQHFLQHTNNDPEEKAQCPLCHEKHKLEGIYIHLAKQHFIPIENSKPTSTGGIRREKEHKPKIFSQQQPKPSSSGGSYQNDRRHERNQRCEQFDPQRSSNHIYSKPHSSSQNRSNTDRNRQQVAHSELSEKSDASSPESDRNGNDVEHNLMHAPREDIRSFRIPKKKTGEGS